MKYALLFFLFLSQMGTYAQKLALSTTSDSALHYYHLGWQKVMDEGDYSGSARAFAQVVRHDPNFLIGLTLRGRISQDLKEQKQLLTTVEKKQHTVKGDERLLLDAFTELHRLMIIRVDAPKKAGNQLKKALDLSFKNLGKIARKYPEEPYLVSEYLEVLHYKSDAQKVLDQLKLFPKVNTVPFMVGFKAQLLAELGQYAQALQVADQLFLIFANRPKVPKPWVVKASIYSKKGDKKMALKFVKKALKLDSGNIDAQRLLRKLKI